MLANTITATFNIPSDIAAGLQSGSLERVGSVIREAGSKKIVLWLRELTSTPGSSISISRPPLPGILGAAASASVLNLGVSTMGFAVVLQKLKAIENQLLGMQTVLARINDKLDMSFFANFKAAVDMAQMAFTADKQNNRQALALQAINRFLEAEHVYVQLIDAGIAKRSKTIEKYLMTLALAYMAEVQCHMELGEYKTASLRLMEGQQIIRDRTEKYIDILLTSHPSSYLHPRFKDQISLQDFSEIFRWKNRDLDAIAVFESLREELFYLRKNYSEWVKALPPAIVASQEVKGSVFGNENEMRDEALKRLPDIFLLMQGIIECEQRFAAYRYEVEAIASLDMSFDEWKSLAPATPPQIDAQGLMYLIPKEPILVAA